MRGIMEEAGLKNNPSERTPVQFHQWVGLGNNTTPTREKLGKNTTPINGGMSKPNVGLRSLDRLRAVTVEPRRFIMYEL